MAKTPDQYYRAGVGAVIARGDKVLLFERSKLPGNWQFPQGGLDADEEPIDAVWREVQEETGLKPPSLRLLGQHPDTLTYELPAGYRGGRFGRGQSQTWYFFAFDGDDSEIDTSQADEFGEYRWVSMREAARQVASFRQGVYQQLRTAFRGYDTGPPKSAGLGAVSLREVTKDNLGKLLMLQTSSSQQRFVAPNSYSIAQAAYEPKGWLRAIYAGETPVGLLLLHDDQDWGLSQDPPQLLADGATAKPEYFLWRLMIGLQHQGRGYGKAAMALFADYVRTRPNATEIKTSFVPGEGSPEGFYRGLGFEPTGEIDEGEVVLSFAL